MRYDQLSVGSPILRCMTGPIEVLGIDPNAAIDRELMAAVYVHVTTEAEKREKAAERRHKELLAAVTKVTNALGDVAVMLGGRRAA